MAPILYSTGLSLCFYVASKILVCSGLLHADLGSRLKIHCCLLLITTGEKQIFSKSTCLDKNLYKNTLEGEPVLSVLTGFRKIDDCFNAVWWITQEVAAEVFCCRRAKTSLYLTQLLPLGKGKAFTSLTLC